MVKMNFVTPGDVAGKFANRRTAAIFSERTEFKYPNMVLRTLPSPWDWWLGNYLWGNFHAKYRFIKMETFSLL